MPSPLPSPPHCGTNCDTVACSVGDQEASAPDMHLHLHFHFRLHFHLHLQVLCSVDDQAAALLEARRVLRSGGCLIFVEHVAAPPGDPLQRWQRWLNLAVGLLGCNVTRHTLEAIRNAGFAAVDAESFRLPFGLPAAVWAPHVAGTAIK